MKFYSSKETLNRAAKLWPRAVLYLGHLDDLREVLSEPETAAWMFHNKPVLHSEIHEAHTFVLERFNACEECGGSGTYISTLACDPDCETFTCETCGGDGLNLDADEMLEAYKDFVHDTGVEWLEIE